MDPNETLRQIRASIALVKEFMPDIATVNDLVEHFEALDEWLSSGGFLPTEWVR